MKQKTIAFTGKRPQSLPWRFNENDEQCLRLKERLRAEIEIHIKEGYTKFISGMAIGIDTYVAEAVLKLKSRYPYITLEAAIPCKSQSGKWSETDQRRYNAILHRCDEITYVGQEYSPDCMYKRNLYMTDKADLLIAVCEDLSGGTGATVRYANSKGVKVILLNPLQI